MEFSKYAPSASSLGEYVQCCHASRKKYLQDKVTTTFQKHSFGSIPRKDKNVMKI